MATRNKFKFVNGYRRMTAIVEDDSLVVLERLSGKDRVRRVPFDRLGQVVYWRAMPWGRLVVQIIFFLIFASISLGCWLNRLTGGPAMIGFVVLFSPLAVVFLMLIILTIIRQRRHLVLYRAGARVELAGAMRERKFRLLLDEITQLARQTQERLSAQPAAGVEFPPLTASAAMAPGATPAGQEPLASEQASS